MHEADRQHSLRHRVHQRAFNALYGRSLVYNQCWEDPRVDREALKLGPEDEVVVITSAGCNALDYLLTGPRKVHAVDANPRQTALMELKLAGIRRLDWDDFFKLFGEGIHPQMESLYFGTLRPLLSAPSQAFWDEHLHWWSVGRVRRGFYDHGLSGFFARMMTIYIRARPGLERAIERLLHAPDLPEQARVWDEEVEPRLLGRGMRWLLDRQLTLNLLGIPYEQQQAARKETGDSISGYIRESLGYIARNLPLSENYFYKVYVEGRYRPDCCPEYLKESNFERLRELVDRVEPRTIMLTDWLRQSASRPTHLVLLDHMDWMGTAFPDALVEEWEAILDHAAPGARVLFRSGTAAPPFLERCEVRGKPLQEHLTLHPELAEELTKQDRVHTYRGFFIADLPSG
jgi:S-adenosylmethionine-diacylglycerol 3-amino-3-carboxypropyl transferase